jgi:hypothetical protein
LQWDIFSAIALSKMKYSIVRTFILIGILLVTNVGFAQYKQNLETLKTWEIESPDPKNPRFDPSAILIHDGKILTVSDRKEFNDIYELKEIRPGYMKAVTFIQIKWPNGIGKFDDFEGLAFCKGQFLMIEEVTRSLVWVDPKTGNTRIETPDIKKIHKTQDISFASDVKGGGFEGIACDETNNKLYIANERLFRMVYVYDLQKNEVIDLFDVPAGNDLPRLQGGIKVFPDFSDAHFLNGSLFLL